MKSKEIQVKPKKLSVAATKEVSYDTDFYKWAFEQAELLKKKDFKHVDLENIIEEIECLGRSEKRALRSYIKNVLVQLLKIEYQPHEKGNSKPWEALLEKAAQKSNL